MLGVLSLYQQPTCPTVVLVHRISVQIFLSFALTVRSLSNIMYKLMCLYEIDMVNRKYGLDDNTIDFIGHALALHRDDRYLDLPAVDTVKRMKVTAI